MAMRTDGYLVRQLFLNNSKNIDILHKDKNKKSIGFYMCVPNFNNNDIRNTCHNLKPLYSI